jgi:hypothetical protein
MASDKHLYPMRDLAAQLGRSATGATRSPRKRSKSPKTKPNGKKAHKAEWTAMRARA